MSQLSGSSLLQERRFLDRRIFSRAMMLRLLAAGSLAFGVAFVHAQEAPPAPVSEQPRTQEPSTRSIRREVKEIYEKSGKAVGKIRGTDQHGDLCGTGFFIDPAGTLYTASSVGGDT